MTDQQLKDYCEAEFENIEKVVQELLTVVKTKDGEYSIVELAAVATFIHNFYNGIENILKRILIFKQIQIHDTPTWHRDLLKLSLEVGVINSGLYDHLSNYLSFRHFFVHAYFFNLKWEDMKPLAESIEDIMIRFKQTIYSYLGQF